MVSSNDSFSRAPGPVSRGGCDEGSRDGRSEGGSLRGDDDAWLAAGRESGAGVGFELF